MPTEGKSGLPFAALVEAMRDASVYSSASSERGVQVRQTHMSVVFLVDDVVYKIKKPVDFGFVDYTTLEKRKAMCENEVRLNQRLAPSVYLGVVAIYASRSGSVIVEPPKLADDMRVVEYAVKMVRLADDDTLLHAVRHRSVRKKDLEPIVNVVATFHNKVAARSPLIAKFGSFDTIAFNVRENFAQTKGHVASGLIEAAVYDDVQSLQLKSLERLRPLIDLRVAQGCPCDSHGDLRLEHVYRQGENIHIIDCIEFNDRFRYEDPLCDISFLYMDLFYETCSFRLPNALLDYYMKASDICPSTEVKALALFYASYRSVVRAKVVGITATDQDSAADVRDVAHSRSHKHWNVARELILPANQRIGLVLVSGLPGSGKSTVTRYLATRYPADRCVIIRTDTVRKEAPENSVVYTDSSKAEIYSLVLERTVQGLKDGKIVFADATFNLEGQLQRFREVAHAEGLVFAVLLCQCRDEAETRRRLQSRSGDASDADWRVYDQMRRSWVGPTESLESVEVVETTGSLETTYTNAVDALCRIGL